MEDEVRYYYDSHATEKDRNLAIIKGIAYQKFTRSYRVGKSGPAPHVIFEVASDETWGVDLEEKPLRYAHMGVQEYFAYDPYEPLIPESGNRRLFGWQLDPDRRIMMEMPSAPDGSLWSHHLESRLVPDGYHLRLYDEHNQMRLTGAEEMARQADELRRQTDALNKRRIQVYSEKLRSLGIDPDQI